MEHKKHFWFISFILVTTLVYHVLNVLVHSPAIANKMAEMKNDMTTANKTQVKLIGNSSGQTRQFDREFNNTLPTGNYTPDWQTVDEGVLYVYSAHLDPRQGSSLVRVFGAMHMDHINKTVTCQLFSRGSMVASVQAEVLKMDMAPVRFRSTDLNCHFDEQPSSTFPVDAVLTLMTGGNSTPAGKLLVESNFRTGADRNFTVCLWSPLHTSNTKWLVEWIETNIVFGAELIFIYVLSLSSQVQSVLEYYQSLGIVQLMRWNEPIPNRHRSLHVHLQMTMIGDCHQRNVNKTKYIVGIDLDELIVPRDNVSTWQEMIDSSGCPDDTTIAALHMLFEMNRDSKMDPICSNQPESSVNTLFGKNFIPATMCITQRMPYIIPYPSRTKLIASPTNRTRLHVHTGGELGHRHVCKLNVAVGALHHYRKEGIIRISGSKPVYDNHMHAFKNEISHRVSTRLMEIGDLLSDAEEHLQ